MHTQFIPACDQAWRICASACPLLVLPCPRLSLVLIRNTLRPGTRQIAFGPIANLTRVLFVLLLSQVHLAIGSCHSLDNSEQLLESCGHDRYGRQADLLVAHPG